MLRLSVPEKTVWADPFGALAHRPPYDVQEVNGVHFIRRKIHLDDREEMREEQKKLLPLLDNIYDTAAEALKAVPPAKQKSAEINISWRSFHHSANTHIKIVCHRSEQIETDHFVLLSTNCCTFPSILDPYFPALPVVTTTYEHEAGTSVISLDGYRHKIDAMGIPDEIRFVYPAALDRLRQCIEDPEGPLYDFDFKIERPDKDRAGSFNAILKLH